MPLKNNNTIKLLSIFKGMWFVLFFVGLIFGVGYRSYIVNHTHSLSAGCSWCFIAPVWAHDLLFLAIVLILSAFVLFFKSSKLRLLWAFFIIPAVVFFWLDIIIYKTLNYRVYLNDVILFSRETNAIYTFIQALKFSPKDLALVIFSVVNIFAAIGFVFFARRSVFFGRLLIYLAIPIGVIFLFFTKKDPDYIFNDTVMNFMEINYPSGVDKEYLDNKKNIGKIDSIKKIGIDGENTSRNNVILLVIESLSAYHLETLLPNQKKYTPFLDNLAKQNSYFSNFFANGFTTDGGLISLLTGRNPVPSIGRYKSVDAFQGFDCIDDSLPQFMKSKGYKTNFFSNSSLEFTNLGGWTKSIGFDYVEGPNNNFYKEWEKGLFGAVEDRALFLRLLNWMDGREETANEPYMAVLMTHSTHPPFVDPVTKSNIETEVYQYMDKSVEQFFNELTKRGFFTQGGILLITGDHRAYTPISHLERISFGETARARIPFIAVGDAGIDKGKIETYAQQVDLINSMKALLNENKFLIPAHRGVFLGKTPRPAEFILHASGKDRDQIKVFFPEGELGNIKLNGNETVWQGRKPPESENILNAIAADRTSRGPATVNYVDYLYKVTFDTTYGAGKFATGSNCTKNYSNPNY